LHFLALPLEMRPATCSRSRVRRTRNAGASIPHRPVLTSSSLTITPTWRRLPSTGSGVDLSHCVERLAGRIIAIELCRDADAVVEPLSGTGSSQDTTPSCGPGALAQPTAITARPRTCTWASATTGTSPSELQSLEREHYARALIEAFAVGLDHPLAVRWACLRSSLCCLPRQPDRQSWADW
jgi:hypothetical protein